LNRPLPKASATATFAPHLKAYVSVTKLLITVAAASIAFGGSNTADLGVHVAKIILAFSILYGTVFAALLQFFYEQYAHDLRYYVPLKYGLIQGLGFSALVCFISGYFVWAFYLH